MSTSDTGWVSASDTGSVSQRHTRPYSYLVSLLFLRLGHPLYGGGSKLQNRHPADRLADVRFELKRLGAEEERLRAYLLEHPQDRAGEEHIAVIGSQSRKRVDLKGLADEVGALILQRFTSFRSAMIVRLQQRQSDA